MIHKIRYRYDTPVPRYMHATPPPATPVGTVGGPGPIAGPKSAVGKMDSSTVSSTRRAQISESDETTFQEAERKLCNKLTLALEMREGLRVRTYDRRWRNLKVYKQCFLHSDAVQWMVEYYLQKNAMSEAPENAGVEGTTCSTTDAAVSYEESAVDELNKLIDAGYIHHVCNEHKFVVGESATLYFRFQNDSIDADLRSIQKRKEVLGELYVGVSSVISDETADLRLAIDRLTSNVEKYSHMLDDAHGRILILEEALSAVSFALTSMIYCVLSYLLYRSIMADGERSLADVAIISFTFVLLLLGTINFLSRGPWYAYDSMFDHVRAYVRLVRLQEDVEDAFMRDVDGADEFSMATSSFDGEDGRTGPTPLLQKRTSMIEMMRHKLSVRQRSVGLTAAAPAAPIRARQQHSLPSPSEWPHYPVLVCANSDAQPDLIIPNYGRGPVPLGKPFAFSSDLFEGTCCIRLRDLPSDDAAADAEYFLGRRRKFQAIVQGRFKEPLKLSDVLTGHEFAKPLKGLPPPWVVSAGTNLIRRLAPGANIVLHEKQPRALAILAATSQLISADMPGNEPDITSNQIDEDVSLFGGIFEGGHVTPARRKRHLASPDRAAKYSFDTESVYTFDFYQNILDTATYSLDLGFTKLGMTKVLDGQPIQILAKHGDGRSIWNLQVWHKNLLPKEKQKRA